ncbi:MAG: L,D-transpeptidase [Nitrospira sp.]|nr:L,D-transpeptidase [Nitrospira sp.]
MSHIAPHRAHQSCRPTVEGTGRPYPMSYTLRFHLNCQEVSCWIHGRDLPNYPTSHGCIGLYDALTQRE